MLTIVKPREQVRNGQRMLGAESVRKLYMQDNQSIQFMRCSTLSTLPYAMMLSAVGVDAAWGTLR